FDAILGPAVKNDQIDAFLPAERAEPGAERLQPGLVVLLQAHADNADPGNPGGGPDRRCGRRQTAGGQCEEVPALHSMTSSARASNDCGTVRPSAWAVFRLITSSSLVGC